ncbi:MAG: O-antigen ligase family protein [Bacilli bacterium]|jgi:O-antigen ligase|nr:O-antigen ligase family protein [Bacilli bacterium]
MKIVKRYFNKFFNKYNTDERLITILAVSLFSPYPITAVVLVGIAIFVLIKRNLLQMMKTMKSTIFIIVFSFYWLLTSLIFQNYLGALISVGVFFIAIDIIYYRYVINKKLFQSILNIIVFLSLISLGYGIFEQLYYHLILNTSNYFTISNLPQYRVHAFYFNANYYSLMILFVECICVYKFLNVKKYPRLYVSVGILNFFAIYLTGTRVAWLSLLITWLAMFIVARNKTAIFATISYGITIIASLIFKLPLIPRLIDYGASLGRRKVIYDTAFLMMKDTWLFGKGPLTYFRFNKDYYNQYVAKYGTSHLNDLGIASQHTHSLLLELPVSFGLIGTLLIGAYVAAQFRRIYYLGSLRIDKNLMILILGILLVVITNNITDFNIFWIQTATLFFILLGSSDIYRKEITDIKKPIL